MKVALIEPDIDKSAQTIFAGNNALEPLGLEYLASVAIDAGWEAKVFVERIIGDQLVDEIVNYNPDLIGLTCLSCNSKRMLLLARKLKGLILCNIVVGGYHASAVPEQLAKEECIDWVVIGEGEHAFQSILKSFHDASGDDLNRKVLKSSRVKSLAELPFPQRDVTILESCRLLGLMVPAPSEQQRVASVAISRGCPNNCEFCSSRSVWGTRYYTSSIRKFCGGAKISRLRI